MLSDAASHQSQPKITMSSKAGPFHPHPTAVSGEPCGHSWSTRTPECTAEFGRGKAKVATGAQKKKKTHKKQKAKTCGQPPNVSVFEMVDARNCGFPFGSSSQGHTLGTLNERQNQMQSESWLPTSSTLRRLFFPCPASAVYTAGGWLVSCSL